MAKAPLLRCIPIRTVSESNLREHWRKRAKRTQEARGVTGHCMHAFYAHVPELPVTITLTRIAPRALDDDNLRGALKAVRDGVTDWLRLKNDANPAVRSTQGQTPRVRCGRGRSKEPSWKGTSARGRMIDIMSIPAHDLRSVREEDSSFEVPPLSPEEEKSLDEAIQAAKDSGCKEIYLGSFAQYADDE